jgi:lysophospholipase L1-like esterase
MKGRLLAVLSASVLFVLTAVPSSASFEDHTYLALGDSVAFGYSPLLVAGGFAGDPHVFVGYPEIVASTLGMQDVNASCPGETSGGFISLTNGADYLCQSYRAHFPLHVNYTTSQLDYAISYLRTHHDVRLITMDIGANDVFKAGCATAACFGAVFAGIEANLRFIYGQIRNVAHYQHALVTLTYYSLSYDAPTAAGTEALNAPIIAATLAFGGKVASGFDAFKGPALAAGGSSCAAGLLIVLSPGNCDVHPTPKGRDLLAGAVIKALAHN